MIDETLLSDAPGRRALLLGNEAIVRGAIEAGVAVVTGYPGTPASEIGDTLWRLAGRLGIRCEYGVNEKVALEVAAGAAQGGVRSLVSFKHLGLNVAADPLPTLANSGVLAGMVIVTAGDPGSHTSPNEQDHRLLARMARLPMLDPATPEQARAMTAMAFDLSEDLGVPVLVRPTTRVSHTRGIVVLGARRPIVTQGRLVRDPARFVPLPPNARRSMAAHGERLARAEERISRPPWTTLEGAGRLGVVSCGVAACYVREALDDLEASGEVQHLQVGAAVPLPTVPCLDLLSRCDAVLVAEELMPVVEEQLRSLALDLAARPRILGKISGDLPLLGEYSPSVVRPALARLLGRDAQQIWPVTLAPDPAPLPTRPPVLCPGCPHRATFAAARLVFPEDRAVYVNDIGCYSLGYGEPLGCADFIICMGSSVTQASGMSTALAPRTALAFIGDSTFFHSGMTGLLNAVSCGHDLVLIILDNGTTAMTGHQPHPGIADERGWPGPSASIEAVVRGLGVTQLWVVDPVDAGETIAAMSQARDVPGVRVVVARHRCPVDERRTGEQTSRPKVHIDAARCRHCVSKEQGMPCSLEPDRGISAVRVLRSLSSTEAGRHEVAPCSAACPLSVCVPAYTGLVGAGRLDAAAELVRERNPLPSVCSRVCHAPCEEVCLRCAGSGPEGAVAINALKRVALDGAVLTRPVRPAERRTTSVAVVGSGPAGLACADELARRGHTVTVYEAAAEPGGMLRYGIPPYRLPREVLDRDIAAIVGDGVEVRCGVALGRDVTIEQLLEQHDALFLGVGAWIGSPLGAPGDSLDGVTDCLTFLGRALGTHPPDLDGTSVVVVGGGDAAIDCARVSRRLGADPVTIVYRRGRGQMPAEDGEIERAIDEGIALCTWTRPLEVIDDGQARARALRCLGTEAGPAGADGRATAVDRDGTHHEVEADLVIAAVGQRLALVSCGLALTDRGTIAADPLTCATSIPRVYAGGDAATGPRTVIEALAAGKRAAWAIDCMLVGAEDALPCPVPASPTTHGTDGTRTRTTVSDEAPRAVPPSLAPAACREGFDEVVGVLGASEAVREASRCLGCAPCAACDVCTRLLGCPAIAKGTDGKPVIDQAMCNGCGLCVVLCPAGAIVSEAEA